MFPNPATPTGTITFWSSGSPNGTVLLDGSGTASLTLSPQPRPDIAAVYSGDTTFAAGISSPFAFVDTMPATTTIASGASPARRSACHLHGARDAGRHGDARAFRHRGIP